MKVSFASRLSDAAGIEALAIIGIAEIVEAGRRDGDGFAFGARREAARFSGRVRRAQPSILEKSATSSVVGADAVQELQAVFAEADRGRSP